MKNSENFKNHVQPIMQKKPHITNDKKGRKLYIEAFGGRNISEVVLLTLLNARALKFCMDFNKKNGK